MITQSKDGFRQSPWEDSYQNTEPESFAATTRHAGPHFHNEDYSGDVLRYYAIHPVGPWKEERVGSWTDAFASNQYLAAGGVPVPPKSVLDDLVQGQHGDLGMSGGTEYPDRTLTGDEYLAVRRNLIEVYGCLDITPRTPPLNHAEYTIWLSGWRHGRQSK